MQVANGTCTTTILDSVTAAYHVAYNYCSLDILPDKFVVKECEMDRSHRM